jgi:murein DD-endopeptidase MepM/ murein hydrolase activator NlpD
MTTYTLTIKDGVFTFAPVTEPTPAAEPFWVAWPVQTTELPRTTNEFNKPRDYANHLHEGKDCDSWINATGQLATVIAAQDGIVEFVNDRKDVPSYGLHVVIRHPWAGVTNRYRTLYAHLSQVLVSVGANVKRGDPIGIAGNSGVTTQPLPVAAHLHFGVYDTVAGMKGYVRCKDCSGLWPEGVLNPNDVLRL